MSRRVSALPTTPEEIVAHLRGPSSAPPGYQLNRVILCNYWHFGLLTFDIPHGRLFLDHVLQANEGCDIDFLRGRSPVVSDAVTYL